MRAALELSLPETAIINRATRISDGMGGHTTSMAAIGTADCRLSPVSGDERKIAEQLGAVSMWTVTLPALTPIDEADLLLIDNRLFEVKYIRAFRSFEISRRVLVTENE